MEAISQASGPQLMDTLGGAPPQAAAHPPPEMLLPSPDRGARFSDPAVLIAFLMQQSAFKERDAQDTLSLAHETALIRHENEEIQAMSTEASHLLWEGIATGSLGCAAGGLQFTAAMATPTANTADAAKQTPACTGPGDGAKNPAPAPPSRSLTPDVFHLGAKLFDSAKEGSAAIGKSGVEEDEIDLKHAAFAAQLAQQALDDSRRAASTYDAAVARALDYMKAFLDMQNQTAIAQAQRV